MDLSFVNLGIEIEHLRRSISVFGYEIAFYAIIVALGMLAGLKMAIMVGKKNGDNPDDYYDYMIYAIISGILGARIYYVIFEWKYYGAHLLEIFNTRAGGLAIYGGIIAAVLALVIFTRIKKKSFFGMADASVCGLALGQAIGRWGNFFNGEAFGGYTNNLFAMRIKRSAVRGSIPEVVTEAMREHLPELAEEYIQVHPTFLYESLWNIGVLAILLLVRKHRRFRGQMFAIYLCGYGVGRAWIEGLRTDQLQIGNTGIAVSQVLSIILAIGAGLVIVVGTYKCRGKGRLQKEDAAIHVKTGEK